MTVNKHFKYLDTTVEKEIKKIKLSDATYFEHNKERFVRIPKSAFKTIYDHPLHAELKKGLWVQTHALNYCEEVERVMHKENMTTHHYSYEERLSNINWSSAKRIAQGLDARIMTPAEMICVVDYLRHETDKTIKHNTLNYTLNQQNREWLDMLIDEEKTVFMKNHVENSGHVVGGYKTELKMPVEFGHYDLSTMYQDTGIPFKRKSFSQFKFDFLSMNCAGVVKAHEKIQNQEIVVISNETMWDTDWDLGMRIVFPGDIHQKKK